MCVIYFNFFCSFYSFKKAKNKNVYVFVYVQSITYLLNKKLVHFEVFYLDFVATDTIIKYIVNTYNILIEGVTMLEFITEWDWLITQLINHNHEGIAQVS